MAQAEALVHGNSTLAKGRPRVLLYPALEVKGEGPVTLPFLHALPAAW